LRFYLLNITHLKPNLEEEWMEALRYREFERMGKRGWMEYASKNYTIISYSKIEDVLNNIDLDYESLDPDKRDRFEEAFENGEVEVPIAVKFSENDYDLLGGNTRLAGLIKNGINPKLFVVDLTKGATQKLKRMDVDEMDSGSSGSYEAPLFGKQSTVKRKISSIPNLDLSEQQIEVKENGIQSSGAFDVPAFGKTTKGGRKDPLKIDGPDSIYKGRAVTDKNFPKWGGPDSVFVKVKEKCKKFPYCNQGNTGAIELVHEDEELKESIKQISNELGIPYKEIEKIVLNEINKIFI
jgi:hypothetical protein